MGKFWLIQRGKFRKPDTATEFFGPEQCNLVSGEYMGSAEFEWGAIPRAFRRIMDNYEHYSMHVTDVTSIRGVPFCLFCRDEFYDDIIREIRRYLAVPYPLKERSNMHDHFKKSQDRLALETNFWWCIDMVRRDESGTGNTIGDWIGFLGATDRMRAMQRVLDDSFNSWWMTMPEDQRVAMLKEAYRR